MIKTAKKGEVPGTETYYEIPPQKAGHDYKPTEKDIEIEKTADNLENHSGIVSRRMDREVGDVAPVIDWLKQMALDANKERINRTKEEPHWEILFYIDEESGREVMSKIFMGDDGRTIEFVAIDAKTGDIIKQENIDAMNKLPLKVRAMLEDRMRKDYPGEKSN